MAHPALFQLFWTAVTLSCKPRPKTVESVRKFKPQQGKPQRLDAFREKRRQKYSRTRISGTRKGR